MNHTIYNQLISNKGKKFAVLVDPDKFDIEKSENFINNCLSSKVDLLLVGGSLLFNGKFNECISKLKKQTEIPVVIFPGEQTQIDKNADAILLLSLISGRNPDLLIGKHVLAAPYLKQSGLEIIPTGYILIDGGNNSSVSYISNTLPIPADKAEIAASTAMAGEMLGLKMIYLEAGSGAINHISAKMTEKVKQNISIPLIVGGGINSPQKAIDICKAGADMIVVGNAIEKQNSLIIEISNAVHSI